LSSEQRPLTATGDQVEVRPPTESDVPAYVEAVTRSARRLSDFAVPDPHNLPAVIAAQSGAYRTFMVWARASGGEHGLVGRVNIANITRGSFLSATMGYDAYDPYAGRGLFAEGLALVVDLAFEAEPHGLGLHRVEANIQPANARSAGLVRSLGFVHEGFSRQYLHLPGADGRRAWRDHDRYAVLASDWPAVPFRRAPAHRLVVVVNGTPAWDGTGVARQLAVELGLPLLSTQHVPPPELWSVLEASPIGGVVEGQFSAPELRMGLARARLDPVKVPVLEPVPDASKRDVTGLALRVRAAYA
jgi:ribosomal-protein-alanine N-acetyltransferase